jgi:hypothetical protein
MEWNDSHRGGLHSRALSVSLTLTRTPSHIISSHPTFSPSLPHEQGIEIEGSDWSGTFLRKDQQQYLCNRASGVNPITKISTKESLMCPE